MARLRPERRIGASAQQRWTERATVEDIAAAYRFFLRRPPDADGFAHYERLVADGIDLERLIGMFLDSVEYKQRSAPDAELTVVDLGGYAVCVRRSEADFGRGIVETREYEPHVRRALSDLLRPGQTFVDIGANVGVISFLAAKLVGDQGSVVALEPYPDNLQSLYAGIVQNGLSNVRVLPFAASDQRGVVSLTGGTSNAHVVPADIRRHDVYTQSIVLDEALAELPSIDVVKIDIEGHEPRALTGFARLLRKHDPTLLTEFNPVCLREFSGVAPRDYANQLLSHYNHLHVITAFGDSASFTAADDLLEFWERRNREVSAQKLVPEGMLHLDIVATNR